MTHVRKRLRLNAHVHVSVISLHGAPFHLTVCYKNDRPVCHLEHEFTLRK